MHKNKKNEHITSKPTCAGHHFCTSKVCLQVPFTQPPRHYINKEEGQQIQTGNNHYLCQIKLHGMGVGCSLVMNLVAQNRESRIAWIPESPALNRQNFHNEKHRNEANHSKVESWKIDSAYQCLAAILESRDSNRPIQNPWFSATKS